MKVLTFSTLYPNAVQYNHGIFVETRLKNVIKQHGIDSCVIAPVPWFPFRSKLFGHSSQYARVPAEEIRHDITIYHPRYLVIPKIGMIFTPFSLAITYFLAVKKLRKTGFDFDLVDAHYYYPDGVSAALIKDWINRPLIVTARGTDINLIPRYKIPRRLIQWAIEQVDHTITVCEALRKQVIELGAKPENVTTLRNGVDLQLFRPPEDRQALKKLRSNNNLEILSVGHLIDRKGHDLVVRAVSEIPDVHLTIVGEGEERGRLEALISSLQINHRVTLAGLATQEELRDFYGCADILVLASSREGWANVLLESMACGTCAVATRAGGTPEIVTCRSAGVLVDRNAESIRDGIVSTLKDPPSRLKTREFAEQFSWDRVADGVKQQFDKVSAH